MEQAKKIAKANGVKGFRKVRVKGAGYLIGRQCERVANPHQLLDQLLAAGYRVAQLGTCRELADKGLLDTVSIC